MLGLVFGCFELVAARAKSSEQERRAVLSLPSTPPQPPREIMDLLEVDGADVQFLHGSRFDRPASQRIPLATPQHSVLVNQGVLFFVSKGVSLQPESHRQTLQLC